MPAARLTRRARTELGQALRWIANDNVSAARALQEAVAKAAEMIGDHPEIGRARPEIARGPYRITPLTGYPYLLVYNAVRRPPLIVRFVHGARDLPTVLSDL